MNEKEEILLQEESQESMEISDATDMQILETVSGGDLVEYTSVSGGDIYLFSMPEDDVGATTNYLLSAILFFLVATWCIDRIKSGIRRLMKHE